MLIIVWGCLTIEDVYCVPDASELYAASIFRVEVCKNICIILYFLKTTRNWWERKLVTACIPPKYEPHQPHPHNVTTQG